MFTVFSALCAALEQRKPAREDPMKLNVNVDLSVDISITKECTSCHEVKPLEAFSKQAKGKFGRRTKCRVCASAYDKMKKAEHRAVNEVLSFAEICARTPEKKCYECKRILPSVDFGRFDSRKDGLQPKCRSCFSAYDKMRRAENKAANELVSIKELRERTSEKKCGRCKKILPSVNFYRENIQTDGLDNRCRSCRDEHSSQYRKDNPDKVRGYAAKRRALKLGLFKEDISYEELVARDGEECGYCHVTGIALEIEHIWPLNMEGWHVPNNLTLACKPCNSSKGATHPAIYVAREGHSPNQAILNALELEHELTRTTLKEDA